MDVVIVKLDTYNISGGGAYPHSAPTTRGA